MRPTIPSHPFPFPSNWACFRTWPNLSKYYYRLGPNLGSGWGTFPGLVGSQHLNWCTLLGTILSSRVRCAVLVGVLTVLASCGLAVFRLVVGVSPHLEFLVSAPSPIDVQSQETSLLYHLSDTEGSFTNRRGPVPGRVAGGPLFGRASAFAATLLPLLVVTMTGATSFLVLDRPVGSPKQDLVPKVRARLLV